MPDAHAISSFVGLQNYRVVGWKRYHKSWIEIRLEQREQAWRCVRCRRALSNRRSRLFVRLRDLDISEHKFPRFTAPATPRPTSLNPGYPPQNR